VTPILPRNALEFISHSAEQTQRIGERLGRMLDGGDVVCLEGDLGAGKTCLAQGIGRGLGAAAPLTSPTFIIVNQYRLPSRLYRLQHVDLYRVETVAEARATGLEDLFFGEDVCIVEWAERVVELLPPERLWIRLRYVDESKRCLQIEAQGHRFERLVERLRGDAFGV